MEALKSPWIGNAIAVLVVIVVCLFFWMAHWLEKRGVLKNYSRGLGRGLLEVETMLRPSRQYVRNAKECKQTENHDERGAGPDPE